MKQPKVRKPSQLPWSNPNGYKSRLESYEKWLKEERAKEEN